MDPYPRDRASSVGASHNIRRPASPSSNPAFTSQANAFGHDPILLGSALANGNANASIYDNDDNPNSLADSNYSQQQRLQNQQQFQQQSFNQAQYTPQSANPHYQPQSLDQSQQAAFATQFMSQGQSSSNTSFAALDDPQSQFGASGNDDLNQDFDSSLYLDFDSALGDSQPGVSSNNNPNLYDNMSTAHQISPEAPHLLQPDMRQSLDSSAQSSPSFYQDAFASASHSRHASLSPSSAAYMQGPGGDFTGMSFQGHRRLPSDQHSDVSSTHASPYLQDHDGFDGQPSPMLNGAQDPVILGPDSLGLSQFSLSEQQHISPGHSSHPSPNLAAQQGMPLFNGGADGLGMLGMDEQFNGLQGPDSYTGQEAFPVLQQNDSAQDIGQASQMSPPEITFDPAPPSKQPSFNEANPAERGGALSPPDRILSRNRQRARSDPYSSAASSRANSPARPRSPSDGGLRPSDSLSAHSRSRSSSPSGPPGGVQKSYRRSSSPVAPASMFERSRMLERAHPPSFQDNGRAPSPTPSNVSNEGGAGSGARRAQKHPATFQCSLCPKRFTRAYNLRSHLRTHTDERPFVCTVCGKAFARQHDRKRHEGLHSGEKKFVCRGTLTTPGAGSWGCGRKFARADALGRHFRSEAGRSCIKPLLDEEARDRGANMMGHADQGMMVGSSMPSSTGQQQMMPMQATSMGSADFNGMVLPAALLQQYPALAGIAWDAPASGNGNNMGGAGDFDGSDYGASDYDNAGNDYNDYSARSSFDAYEDDENGYKSDAGYGNTLAPTFVQGTTAWPLASGANGYYSDRGGQ